MTARRVCLILLAWMLTMGYLPPLQTWEADRAYAASEKWTTVGSPGISNGYMRYHRLAVGDGTPYVTFQDVNGRLNVMTYSSTDGWRTLDNTGLNQQTFYTTPIEVHHGAPYIVYPDMAHDGRATVMKYSEGDGWAPVGNPESLPPMGYNAGMDIDEDGTPYIAFTNNFKIFVMKHDPADGNWKFVGSTLYAEDSPEDIQLKMDNGVLFLTYQYNYNGYKTAVMKYTEATNWTSLGDGIFNNNGNYYSAFAVYDGQPYLAFGDRTHGNKATVVAYSEQNGWKPVGVEGFSPNGAYNTSLAMDEDGTPFVAFRDGASAKATVMKYGKDGVWGIVGNAEFSEGLINDTWLAIDHGIPYIAYQDSVYGQSMTVMKLGEAFTVTYSGNGATAGHVPVDSHLYDDQATVTTVGNTGNLEKPGYAFDGWNTAADGSGTDYKAGDTFTISNSNVLLYAKWTSLNVTVDYAPGEHGTISAANETVVKGGHPAAVPSVTPHSGYRFTGWSSDGGLTKLSSGELKTTVVTQAITYTAYFAPIVKGDLSGDGILTAADALMLTKYLRDSIHLTPEELEAADVNGDGIVDEKDVKAILAIITGKG
ncbi:InlB B-repeat-containing protein [Paenibacillus sanguinis]|uniref:InlB B-repeat-containing protein n=1 Tax=Paenibacillus sanguinis TaxID=225906 RepID=UPI00196A055A|nr:InlB B-repeat-containing protein [Paenibacillus sanguinis]